MSSEKKSPQIILQSCFDLYIYIFISQTPFYLVTIWLTIALKCITFFAITQIFCAKSLRQFKFIYF